MGRVKYAHFLKSLKYFSLKFKSHNVFVINTKKLSFFSLLKRLTYFNFILQFLAGSKFLNVSGSVEMDAVERANYESLAERNNHRISILQEGCSIRDDVLLNAVDLEFNTLRSLQRNISSNVRVDEKFRRTTENFDIQIKYREQLVDLFHVDEYGLMTCLPPKGPG